MKYQGLWGHFWCQHGFAFLLRRFLDESQSELRFGRVEKVTEGSLLITQRPTGETLRRKALLSGGGIKPLLRYQPGLRRNFQWDLLVQESLPDQPQYLLPNL